MKLEFYKCAHCGNVAVKLFDQGAPLSCCGEEMALLRAGETDGAAEKHVPVVTVGETIHVEAVSYTHLDVYKRQVSLSYSSANRL